MVGAPARHSHIGTEFPTISLGIAPRRLPLHACCISAVGVRSSLGFAHSDCPGGLEQARTRPPMQRQLKARSCPASGDHAAETQPGTGCPTYVAPGASLSETTEQYAAGSLYVTTRGAGAARGVLTGTLDWRGAGEDELLGAGCGLAFGVGAVVREGRAGSVNTCACAACVSARKPVAMAMRRKALTSHLLANT